MNIEAGGGFAGDTALFPPGTGIAEAKEYLFNFTATLKLTEKALTVTEAAVEKWRRRADLARNRGDESLALEAEKELSRQKEKRDALASETEQLRDQCEKIRAQIPGIAARERSVDPDLLEQELRILAGEMPGDGPTARTVERRIDTLAAESSADSALEALKAKMGRSRPQDGDSP